MFFIFNLIGRLLYGKDYEELSRRAARMKKPRRETNISQTKIANGLKIYDERVKRDTFCAVQMWS